jgi:hypothetical protein
MSSHGTTSLTTDTATQPEWGAPNKITLGLLLIEYLRGGETTEHTSALARMERAICGLISPPPDSEHPELTYARRLSALETLPIWLTQCATVSGYLLGSGVDNLLVHSYRQKMLATLATWEQVPQIAEDEYMTKRAKAREITAWVRGDGRFNRDMGLAILWQWLYSAIATLNRGSSLTWQTGLEIAAFQHHCKHLLRHGETPQDVWTRLMKPGSSTYVVASHR